VFMWLVEQKGILTKDNMTRRRWQGDTGCYLCGQLESCDHLLFDCPISKVVWGVDAYCFHQRTRPLSYGQFWHWVEKALPGGGGFHAGTSCDMLGDLEDKKLDLF
jgi:hypothetical protein